MGRIESESAQIADGLFRNKRYTLTMMTLCCVFFIRLLIGICLTPRRTRDGRPRNKSRIERLLIQDDVLESNNSQPVGLVGAAAPNERLSPNDSTLNPLLDADSLNAPIQTATATASTVTAAAAAPKHPDIRLVNYMTYILLMSLSFIVYWICIAYMQSTGQRYVDWEGQHIFLFLAMLLCSLYFMELFSEHHKWSTIVHHLVTVICVSILVDFTNTEEEIIQGIIFIGYVTFETNIYVSLVLNILMKKNPALANAARIANRVSVHMQLITILVNQAATLGWLALTWDEATGSGRVQKGADPFFKAVFLVSDFFWLLEQFYCLSRSYRSLHKKTRGGMMCFERGIFRMSLAFEKMASCCHMDPVEPPL